jgi:hypothetical protein
MPILHIPRQEAFAQGLARGLSALGASREAVYSRHERPWRAKERAAWPKIIDRVAEITLARVWGGDADLARVFHELMRLVEKAEEKDSTAGLAIAKGLLTEAGRLRTKLPPGVGAAPHVEPRSGPILRPRMTTEEWIEAFAPKR